MLNIFKFTEMHLGSKFDFIHLNDLKTFEEYFHKRDKYTFGPPNFTTLHIAYPH